MQLSSVDIAFCQMWARRMVRDRQPAEEIRDAIVARANRPNVIDLTDARQAVKRP
jgi:hypothetical protein